MKGYFEKVFDDFRIELTSYGFFMIFIGAIINIFFSYLTDLIGLPLWIDSIGSIIVSVLSGPWTGLLSGIVTFVIFELMVPNMLPYFLITSIIALITGYFYKFKIITRKMNLLNLLGTCFLLGIVSTLIYSPITVLLHGVNGNWMTSLFIGTSDGLANGIFTAIVGPELLAQLLDKTITVFIAFFILILIPKNYWKTTLSVLKRRG